MARFSPRVLPDPGPNFQATLAQAMAAIDAKRQRDRQDTFDRVNLHRAGYHVGDTPPTTQAYESNFTGTRFDPERPVMPAALPNPVTGTATTARDPLRTAWDAQTPTVSLAEALKSVPVGSNVAPQEPRLKALPGAFVPELGAFTTRAIYEAPPVPFQVGRGRMVERHDPTYERVGNNLWYSEARSEAGRQRAYAERLAEAERLNQQASAEKQASLLGEILGLSQAQRDYLAAGGDPRMALYQPELPERDRMEIAHKYRMAEIAEQNKWRMGDPNNPEATATSRLNRYAQAVKTVSDAIQRFQAIHAKENFGEFPTTEQIESFIQSTFNITLDDYYRMQRELFRLGGVVPAGRQGQTPLAESLEQQAGATTEKATPRQKTLQERAAELKGLGLSKEAARAILQREGYLQ